MSLCDGLFTTNCSCKPNVIFLWNLLPTIRCQSGKTCCPDVTGIEIVPEVKGRGVYKKGKSANKCIMDLSVDLRFVSFIQINLSQFLAAHHNFFFAYTAIKPVTFQFMKKTKTVIIHRWDNRNFSLQFCFKIT